VLLQGLGGKGWKLLQVTSHHLIAEREHQEAIYPPRTDYF
jgi:hypothetical protein